MPHFLTVVTRKLTTYFGVLFIFTLLTACSPQTPEDVASGYIKAVANNRINKAILYTAVRERDVIGFWDPKPEVKENEEPSATKGKTHTLYSEIQENGGLDSFSATLVLDGNKNLTPSEKRFIEKSFDSATVYIRMKFKNGKREEDLMILIKQSGKWKIS